MVYKAKRNVFRDEILLRFFCSYFLFKDLNINRNY